METDIEEYFGEHSGRDGWLHRGKYGLEGFWRESESLGVEGVPDNKVYPSADSHLPSLDDYDNE